MTLHEVRVVGFLADLVCPERCASCSALVAPADLLCPRCFAKVRRLAPPECPGCGCPAAVSVVCATCAAATSPLRSARAWASYDRATDTSPVVRAIASFKYHGAQRVGRRLAAAMLTRVAHRDVATVVPVPLHPRRLRERGFNQSAVLARHLGRMLGCRVALAAVIRRRDTPSQVSLPLQGRAANVGGAFAVADDAAIRDQTVLLVDDVWTSGATVRAVAEALRGAGAAAFDVLTIARVL
jgi:ComF family protein